MYTLNIDYCLLQVAEKDLEIFDYKEKIKNLEESLCSIQREYDRKEACLIQEKNMYEREIKDLRNLTGQLTGDSSTRDCQGTKSDDKDICESVSIIIVRILFFTSKSSSFS